MDKEQGLMELFQNTSLMKVSSNCQTKVLRVGSIMHTGDILTFYGAHGTGKTQTLLHMCAMLLRTKYRVLFVLPTKQALKGTIDLMRLNITKVDNFE